MAGCLAGWPGAGSAGGGRPRAAGPPDDGDAQRRPGPAAARQRQGRRPWY